MSKSSTTTTATTAAPAAAPVGDITAATALKQLRLWKLAARANAAKNPMTLENPDFDRKPNPYDDWSYLQSALQPETAATGELAWQIVQALTKHSSKADRAVGSLYGLVLGDAFGAPFEFLPVDSRLEPPPRDGAGTPGIRDPALLPYNWLRELEVAKTTKNAQLAQRPSWGFFDQLNSKGQISYLGEFNKFRLLRGQWTDDASMALCLADSMLGCGKYEGGDCRVRYFNWWTCGVNNAFRFDSTPDRTSVGLGGNISQSFHQLARAVGLHKTGKDVPPEMTAKGEDAGNGSMMRLAPVPIRYAGNPVEAMQVAAFSSRATHPGPDAECCCAFMAHFISKAITATADLKATTTLSEFLDNEIPLFLRDVPQIGGTLPESGGMFKVRDVLACKPRDDKTALWNWRSLVFQSEETLRARGDEYNGHPVIPTYFGAYSIDGLCMSLWALHHDKSLLSRYRRAVASKAQEQEQQQQQQQAVAAESQDSKDKDQQQQPHSPANDDAAVHQNKKEEEVFSRDHFEDVMNRVINLRGDSDTTGAIAGQMAGAFFGFQDMMSTHVGRYMISAVRTWDPLSEIPSRALMLADDGGLLDDIAACDDDGAACCN